MVLEGTVLNGVVVLAPAVALPDGTKVQVVVGGNENGAPTLLNLLKHAGALPDMPSDFAAQHDHYIHGTPKQ